jgi:hypothetical protein
LFGLKKYFETRSRTEKPIRMTVGGPEARSPDGQFVVKLVKRPFKFPPELFKPPFEPAASGPPEGEVIKILPCILVGGLDDEAHRIYFSREDAELVWGPKGSWFAVLRYRSREGDAMEYKTFDLRGARPIRDEFEEGKEPWRRPANRGSGGRDPGGPALSPPAPAAGLVGPADPPSPPSPGLER